MLDNAFTLGTNNDFLFSGETHKDDPGENRLTRQGYFKHSDRNKETFLITLELFKEKEKLLRGHVEFIFAALKNMDEYGVNKDLEVWSNFNYASPTSGEAYRDRRLTTNFELSVEIFVCRHVSVWGFQNPVCLSAPREKISS